MQPFRCGWIIRQVSLPINLWDLIFVGLYKENDMQPVLFILSLLLGGGAVFLLIRLKRFECPP